MLLPVEARERLAPLSGADDHLAAANLVEVERVQGLTVLQHDVVRNIDDVVDGAVPCLLQTLPEPLRRGPDRDAARKGAGVAVAQVRVCYLDSDCSTDLFAAFGVVGGGLRYLFAGDGCHLVRDAEHGEAGRRDSR